MSDKKRTQPSPPPLYLREWRDAFGVTQGDVASAAGLSRSTIVRIEATQRARADTRKRLAVVFDVLPWFLYQLPTPELLKHARFRPIPPRPDTPLSKPKRISDS